MRIDLTAQYHERQEAKSLGARWDAAKKVWYIKDMEDLTPFMKWIRCRDHSATQDYASTKDSGNERLTLEALPDRYSRRYVTRYSTVTKAREQSAHARNQLGIRITGPDVVEHCGCSALPWDDCIHTSSTFSDL